MLIGSAHKGFIFVTMCKKHNSRGIRVYYKELPERIKKILRKEQQQHEEQTGGFLSLTRAVYRILERHG